MVECGGAQEICPGLNATKSPSDRNEYRLVRLHNGIEALLVSNSDTSKQKTACSCCVQVGSFSDPAGRCEGLAHYCEHMLFLGSKAYPGECEFEELLSANGGYSNAFTESESTCYYFEVNCTALHKSLDMFAQLLHQPLFTPDSSARELQAIESEFRKKGRSDGVRLDAVFGSFAREGHPWRLFGWGNLESLREAPRRSGVDIGDELRQFFETHYKPSRMRVSVFGVEPLDSLQAAVVASFGAIPGPDDASELDFAPAGMPFTPAELPRLVQVKPVRDTHQLSMCWQLPSQLQHYRSKPERFVSHLLGDEGRGSILSALKREGWATELFAGCDWHGSNSQRLSVEVSLTQEGLRQWQEVAKAVFQYLRMLREQSLPVWLFEEKRLVAKLQYRFWQEPEPTDLVQALSWDMLPFNCARHEDLLVKSFVYEEFREDLVRAILGQLTVPGCFFVLLSSSYGRAVSPAAAGGEDGDSNSSADSGDDAEPSPQACERVDPTFDPSAKMHTEPYFGTEYWSTPITEAMIEQWENCGGNTNLSMIEPNAFIASDFTIHPASSASAAPAQAPGAAKSIHVNFPSAPSPPWAIPHCLDLGDFSPGRIWFLGCTDRFEQPRAEVWVQVSSPYYAQDSTNLRKDVMLSLYGHCLRDRLNETLYRASQAMLRCSVKTTDSGIAVKCGGYSQKLMGLAGSVLADLGLADVVERRFEAQREELLRGYGNAWLKPQTHCAELRRLLLKPELEPPEAWVAELSTATLPELQRFSSQLLQKVGCEVLAMGNLLPAEVEAFAIGSLRMALHLEPQQPVEHEVVVVPSGSVTVWLDAARDVAHRNAAVEVYWQLPGRDSLDWELGRVRQSVLLDLLEDLMYEPLFDALRTKQQLGYSVGCTSRDTHGVHGFTIYVLSAVQPPSVLVQRIEGFLGVFQEHLKNLPDETFASQARALAARWLEPKRTLLELQSSHWGEVIDGTYIFDRKAREAEVLGSIAKEEVCELFREHFLSEARACIVTAVAPASLDAAAEAQRVREACSVGALRATAVQERKDFHASTARHPPMQRQPALSAAAGARQ